MRLLGVSYERRCRVGRAHRDRHGRREGQRVQENVGKHVKQPAVNACKQPAVIENRSRAGSIDFLGWKSGQVPTGCLRYLRCTLAPRVAVRRAWQVHVLFMHGEGRCHYVTAIEGLDENG